MKLRSGTTKKKITSILDIEENTEIEKVIRLNRRFAPKGANTGEKVWRKSYCFKI